MKKICSKCGKTIGFNDSCDCSFYIPKSQKKKEKKEIDRLLTLKRWKKKREQILKRDGRLCQRCFYKYGLFTTTQLQVHHIKPRSKYPELIYEDDNLICLCKTCNVQLGVQEKLDFDWKPNQNMTVL